MNKRFVLAVAALAATGLVAGCSGRPLSPDEQIRRLEKSGCEADADAMVGLRFRRPLMWKGYFDRCMKRYGYTEEELREMWY